MLTLVMVGVEMREKIIFDMFDVSVAKSVNCEVRVLNNFIKRDLSWCFHGLNLLLLHFVLHLFLNLRYLIYLEHLETCCLFFCFCDFFD